MKICMNAVLWEQSVSTSQSIYERLNLPIHNLWVFGYGSLMWDPGFPYVESIRARIYGFHRSLCIRSVRYRGTDDQPGLVFGLDRGGSCTGVSYRIDLARQREVADYLQDREMLNNIYDPSIKSITLNDGRNVGAIVFIVKRQHPSYVNNLTIDQTASIVASACGQRGANLDYVQSTLSSLETIGIRDRGLYTVNQLATAHVNRISDNSDD